MNDLINLDVKLLIDRLAFANTPSYLFKNFQMNSSVLLLSQKLTTEQLIENFRELKGKTEKSMEEWTMLYAVIVALTFKPLNEVRDFFTNLGKEDIKWADRLSELYFANMKVTTDSSFDLKYYSNNSTSINSKSSNNKIITLETA